ncbi:MAG: phosphodiesterase [Saprospiraceae bacterium]|nr:phosphodiesterase [Saprospiraceae bacterium]
MRKNLAFLTLLLWSFAAISFAQTQMGRDTMLPFDAQLKPFYHGVASGDPLSDRVIIWTRVTPEQDQAIAASYVVATDTALKNVVKSGTFNTDISRDYTVKIDVTGLAASTTYYYAFTALGKRSMIGRTKTTPSVSAANLTDVMKFAVVSCSNYEGGYFSAYSRIADRNDLNAVIHLGDYIYEYAPRGYQNTGLDSNRRNIPAKEIITKADYRTRFSLYRLDKDLQRVHQQHPFISIWDDHESANDSYETGAQNHTPGTEGDWQTRKNTSREVYYEWMPIRGQANSSPLYRRIAYGNLLDLIMLDTRLEGRQEPPANFDDLDTVSNPRRMISKTQFDWLMDQLKNSTSRWKVLGNQIIFSNLNVGFAAPNPTQIVGIRAVENAFIDNWKSYPIQRNSIIDTLQKAKINNTIFITGDSHASWAFDVTKLPVLYPFAAANNIPQPNPFDATTGAGYTPATGEGSHGVEFCTPSISSQNFDEAVGDSLTNVFTFAINNPIQQLGNANYNPHLKYVDLKNHGYFVLDVRADSTQADYFYVPNVLSKTTTETWARGIVTRNATNRITSNRAAAQAPRKTIQDAPAPTPSIISSAKDVSEAIIFTVFQILQQAPFTSIMA